MTRAELIEHLAQLQHDEIQRVQRIVNWRTQLVPSILWLQMPDSTRDVRRRAMTSVLDELERLGLLA